MSLQSNFNMTFQVATRTPTGTPPNLEYTWAVGSSIGGYKSSANMSEISDNGTLNTIYRDRLRIIPMALNSDQRIVIGDDIYSIQTDEDFDGLGREMVVMITKMKSGTKAEMGL